MVQPETQHRARYLTEGSRGSVKDRTQQGFPTVKVGWAHGHCLPRPGQQPRFNGPPVSGVLREHTLQPQGWRGCTGSLPCSSWVLLASQSYRRREVACQGRGIQMQILLGCSSMDCVNAETFRAYKCGTVKCCSSLMAGDSGSSLSHGSKDIKPGSFLKKIIVRGMFWFC